MLDSTAMAQKDREPPGSTRVSRPGQVWCICEDVAHPNHVGRPCEEMVFSNDGYCRECHRRRGGSTGGAESRLS